MEGEKQGRIILKKQKGKKIGERRIRKGGKIIS